MHGLAVALLTCAFASAHAQGRFPAGAMKAVETYSRALMAADCEGVRVLSAVIKRHPEEQTLICGGAQVFKLAGWSERLRFPTSNLSSGRYRMVVIPNSRIIEADDGPLITNGLYVVVSSDAGRRWQVIDIGCEQLTAWVKGLYPPYDGHPSFDVASVDRPVASR